MKQQHYCTYNQKKQQKPPKHNEATTLLCAQPKTKMQHLEIERQCNRHKMSSIPNSNPFASWDPLLQMPCGPLSTKAMQRTLLIFGGTMKVVK
jgi:hypothetical protein